MGRCKLCNTTSSYISKEVNVCLKCIRERPADALPVSMQAHTRSRAAFGLPEIPPKDPHGIPCNICVNECRIPGNKTGYCGLRKNKEGKLTGVTAKQGKLSWYHDPLPTNCVGDWVCPGGTGAGYPEYAYAGKLLFGTLYKDYKSIIIFK
jgi:pyruvate formate lyase activating enzyme